MPHRIPVEVIQAFMVDFCQSILASGLRGQADRGRLLSPTEGLDSFLDTRYWRHMERCWQNCVSFPVVHELPWSKHSSFVVDEGSD